MPTPEKSAKAGPYSKKKPGKPRLSRDPHRWGLVAACLTATGVFSYATWQAWPQSVFYQPKVLIGVMVVFVISYGLAGVSTFLLAEMLQRDLTRPANSPKAAAADTAGKNATSGKEDETTTPGA